MNAPGPQAVEHGATDPIGGSTSAANVVQLLEAARFLELLDDGGQFTFQTFPDSDDARGGAHYPRVLHGQLETHTQSLMHLNEAGAGIFVMVNCGDGVVHQGAKTCRTTENVNRVRALFVDLDGAPLQPLLDLREPPDWIVQSSPGRWHGYWKVADCPLTEFSSLQLALALKFGGDKSVADLPRVMRLPGFVHQKEAPFVSRLYLPTEYGTISQEDHA